MECLTRAGQGIAPQHSQCDKGYQTRRPRGHERMPRRTEVGIQVTLELAGGGLAGEGCFLEERGLRP